VTPIVITLAGEPRGKGRPRFVRSTGVAFTPAPTRNYEAALRIAGQQAMAGRPPVEGPLAVNVEATFTVPASWSRRKRTDALAGAVRPTGRPDADNLVKMLDGLNKLVWHDDAQITDLAMVKRYGEVPGLRVEVLLAVGDPGLRRSTNTFAIKVREHPHRVDVALTLQRPLPDADLRLLEAA
jgi:Holliday junction resolvase RusA-like endonuclease